MTEWAADDAPTIAGYRDLTVEEIHKVNLIKEGERQVGMLWREIDQTCDCDPRWLAIAKTELQNGFMALVRAVTKPADSF